MTVEEPERLDLRSHDIAADKRDELLRLFPEVGTEDGLIDFDRLKLVLGETVDVGKERYGMTWPGKADCFKAIQTPSMGTLLPSPDESVSWDAAENLIIEGDNLEVLKLMQKSYLGKVKMIYIDPPYNTGHDFIYPDNYSESLQTYLEFTGQLDDVGKKFNTNSDTDGRFHSKWLNMMYPRLYLAKNLLSEDGIIFISIDDNELDNLKKIAVEIFGEENFVATVIWQKMYAPKSGAKHFSEDHDYVLAFAKRAVDWRPELLPRTEQQDAVYKNPDNDSRGLWRPNNLAARNYYSKGTYSIRCPGGRVVEGPPKGSYWRVSEDKLWDLHRDGRIWWGEDGNNVPAPKIFLSEVKQGRVPQTLWPYSDVGHTQEAKRELLEFVNFENTDNVLDSVKPTRLVRRMLQLGTDSNSSDLVVDFFAGSGATGHAVLAQNLEDGGNRNFILVQLPEPLPEPESSLHSIADITRERVRRVISKNALDQASKLPEGTEPPTCGFRAFKLTDSNLAPWQADVARDAEALTQQLELHVHHVRKDRKPLDLLFEILLKNGFPLTAPIEVLTLAGKQVYSVASGGLIICLEHTLSLEALRAMADLGPERVTCLDDGFAKNDEIKANAVQIFKSKGIVFRTV